MATADDDGRKIAEEMLILRLLAGFHEDEEGRPITDFSLDPEDEDQARAALARQLRDGTLGGIARELLALAIDPETLSQFPHPDAPQKIAPTRKVLFVAPRQGPPEHWARNELVVDFITSDLRAQQLRAKPKLESALQAAKDHFGIGRSQLIEIWKRSGRSDWFFPQSDQ